VLQVWMSGMEIGHAVADLVSGDACPSGKLPLTWPRSYRDTPTCPYFPGEFGETVYGEDIFVGYRYYDSADVEPLYEFGYGLSYTRFDMRNLELSSSILDLDADDTLTIGLEVINTGSCRGKEVVQLYVHDVHCSVKKADKELKGFLKVDLAPGESRLVNFTLRGHDLAHYDTRRARWVVEPGRFEVQVGASSRDIRLRAKFRAVGVDPYPYGPDTPLSVILTDPRTRAVLAKHLPAAALEDSGLAEMAACLPYAPFARAWATFLSAYVDEGVPSQTDRIRADILDELAALEKD